MIQRIQSLYLLAAIALMAFVTTSPLLSFSSAEGDIIATAKGISNGTNVLLSTIPLLVLIITSLVADVAAFLLFKKRVAQIRLLVFSTVLKVGFYGLGAFYIYQFKDGNSYLIATKLIAAFPLISAILSVLAIRAIGKDEALIKSLDRIR